MEWRKSTYSVENGNCVEVAAAGTLPMDWRKSSYSTENGNCAEAAAADGNVLVRDTTDRDGVMLSIPAAAWQTFTDALKWLPSPSAAWKPRALARAVQPRDK
jgi:hypothetical protein